MCWWEKNPYIVPLRECGYPLPPHAKVPGFECRCFLVLRLPWVDFSSSSLFLVAECEPIGKQVFKKPKNQLIRLDVNSSCDEGWVRTVSVWTRSGLSVTLQALCRSLSQRPPCHVFMEVLITMFPLTETMLCNEWVVLLLATFLFLLIPVPKVMCLLLSQ